MEIILHLVKSQIFRKTLKSILKFKFIHTENKLFEFLFLQRHELLKNK